MTGEYSERKSIRLPDFDYSQAGAYFVTICSYNKKCIFGHVINGRMRLNRRGVIVASIWTMLAEKYLFVSLDNWVLMPNHLHGIIWLNEENPGKQSLSAIISAFKVVSGSHVAKAFGERINLWQRGFYEHIIRDQKDLFRIRQYIEDNPMQWEADSENPDFVDRDPK